jgi:hypothetical protein
MDNQSDVPQENLEQGFGNSLMMPTDIQTTEVEQHDLDLHAKGIYVAVLATYKDRNGHRYHVPSCSFFPLHASNELPWICKGHNVPY